MDGGSDSHTAFDAAVESSSGSNGPTAPIRVMDWLPGLIVLAIYLTLKQFGLFG